MNYSNEFGSYVVNDPAALANYLENAFMMRAHSGGLERDVAWCPCTDIIVVSAELNPVYMSNAQSEFEGCNIALTGLRFFDSSELNRTLNQVTLYRPAWWSYGT